jgi:hypothetical protein
MLFGNAVYMDMDMDIADIDIVACVSPCPYDYALCVE